MRNDTLWHKAGQLPIQTAADIVGNFVILDSFLFVSALVIGYIYRNISSDDRTLPAGTTITLIGAGMVLVAEGLVCFRA